MQRKKTPLTNRITEGYILLLLSAFLLFVGPGGYGRITENKLFLFFALTLAYLAALVFAVRREKPKLMPLTAEDACLLAYLLLSAVSALLSPYGKAVLLGAGRREGILVLLLYALVYFSVSRFGNAERKLLYTLAVSLLLFSVIALLQMRGYDPFSLYPEGFNYFGAELDYSGSYIGTIGNTNLVSGFLTPVLPCLALYIILEREDHWRFLLLPPLLLGFLVWWKMGVFGAYLGLGGVLLALPFTAKSKRWKCIFGIGVVLLFASALISIYVFDFGGTALHEAHELLHGRIEDSFGSHRIYIWKEVLSLIRERPLFGTGPDTLLFAGKGFYEYSERFGVEVFTAIDCAHNEYLNICVNQGVLALGAYLAMLLTLAVKWAKRADRDLRVCLLGAAILCYMIQAFFEMSSPMTAPFLWLCLGLLRREMEKRTA